MSFRPHSEKEVRDFLKKPHGRRKEIVDPQTIEKIIARLKELNFVNDEEFARLWVEQRTGSRPKGFRLIKLELQQRGVDRETIEKIFGYYDIKILSTEGAKKLVEKQYPKYAKLAKQEIRQKLGQFLLRRGFDWETVKQVIDEVLKKE